MKKSLALLFALCSIYSFSNAQNVHRTTKTDPTVYLMGESAEITTSEGIFKDAGGDDDYSSKLSQTMVFKPQNANAKISVKFTSFEVESNSTCKYDHLIIYDGADNSAPELGKFCGTTNPGTFTSTATDGSLCFYFKSDGSTNKDGWVAEITEYVPTNMTFTSAEAFHNNTSIVSIGSQNAEILGVKVVVSGDLNPLSLTSIKFNTTGTANTAFLTKAKVFYTGSNSDFSNTNMLGELDSPNGEFTISGTQQLSLGENYFWLAYDISESATDNSVIDAQLVNLTIADEKTPTVTNPDGNRTIKNILLMEAGDKTYKVTKFVPFYDDGGVDGDITKGLKGTIVFQPKDENSKVQIDFTDYKFATMKIYNGNSKSATKIGTYYASSNPGLVKSTSDDGCLTVEVSASTYSSYKGWAATVSNYSPQPMTYVSSEVSQASTDFLAPGDLNQKFLDFKIVTDGIKDPVSTNSIKLNLEGTTDFNNISRVAVHYGGTSSTFLIKDDNKVAEVTSVSSNILDITLNRALIKGDNYFKIVVDVAENSTEDNVIDGKIDKITVASSEHDPTTNNLDGNRTIKNMYLMKTGTNTMKVLNSIAFYDNGGPSANHGKNFQGVVTFQPKDDNHAVQINFSAFHASTLYIYNGNSTSSPRIDSYTGTTSPGLVKSTATDGTLTVKFRSYYSAYSGWEALVSNYQPQPMVYESSSVFQDDKSVVSPGDVKKELIGFNIKTTGITNPLKATELKLDLSQCTQLADISKLTVYFGGDTKNFSSSSNTKLVEITSISDANQSITFDQDLALGDNYFFVAADINADAAQNNVLDATVNKITVSGSEYTPDNNNPEGNRQIQNIYKMAIYKEITTTGGVFYDDGGSEYYYSDNFEGTVIFKPKTPGNKMKIKFNSFSTDDDSDYVEIFDGNAPTDDNSLGKFYGTTLPNEVRATNADGSLCFYFKSDWYGEAAGWEAQVSEYTPKDMEFVSSETQLYSLSPVCKGFVGAPIIKVNIVTEGSKQPLSLQDLTIDTKGTENVDSVRVYYTGKSSSFSRENQVVVVKFSENADIPQFSQALITGDNYFWIAYDVNTSAVDDAVLNTECKTVTISGTTHNNSPLTFAGRKVNSAVKMPMSLGNIVKVSGDITYTDDGGVEADHSREGKGSVIFEPADPTKKVKITFSEFELQKYGVDFYAYNGKATEGSNTIASLKGDQIPEPLKSTSEDGAIRMFFKPSPSFTSKPGWVANVSLYEPRSLFVENTVTEQKERRFLKRNTEDQLILGVKLNVAGEKDILNVEKLTFSTEGCTRTTDIVKAKLYYTNSLNKFTTGEMLDEVTSPNGEFTFDVNKEIKSENGYYFWLCFDIANDAKIGDIVDAVFKSFTAGGVKTEVENGSPVGKRVIRGPLAGVYTINNSAEVDADFISPTEAAEALNALGITAAVTFKIADGEYEGAVVLNEISGVNNTNTITFESASQNRENTIISYVGTDEVPSIITLKGADFVTFKNLTFKAKGVSIGRILDYYKEANNNSFINNVFIGIKAHSTDGYNDDKTLVYCGHYGDDKSLDNNMLFDGNTFINGKIGLYIAGTNAISEFESGLTIRNNTFRNQLTMSVYLQYQNNLLIEGNVFEHEADKKDYWACRLRMTKKNTKIVNNKFDLNFSTKGGCAFMLQQIDNEAGERTLVANNIINLKSASYSINGIEVEDGKNIDIVHNTVNIASGGTSSKAFYFEKRGSSPYFDGCNIKNNIFSNKAKGYLMWSKIEPTNSSISHNNYFTTATDKFNKLGDLTSVNLSEWQTAMSADANSISVDPGFVSETDLHVTGTALKFGCQFDAVTTDFDGDLRNAATPYIGADEIPDTTFVGGYPMFADTEATSVNMLLKSTVAGTAYFVVIPQNADLPTIAQIKAGQNSTGSAALVSGNSALETTAEKTVAITGLTEKTVYSAVVVIDKGGDEYSSVIRLQFSTLDITAPEFINDTPELVDVTNKSLKVKAEINETGNVYYALCTGDIEIYKAEDVKNGVTAIQKGRINSEKEQFIRLKNLSPGTEYNLYVIAEDKAKTPNLQATAVKMKLKTLYGNSVSDFTAESVEGTKAILKWKQSATPSNVIITYTTDNNFGIPANGTAYETGNDVSGGGTVIYSGNGTEFQHTALTSGETYYYRVYSYNSEKEYSQYLENFAVMKNDKWTVLVYMDGDNNLEGNAIKDINEMEMVDLPDDVNVIVQIDRSPGEDYSNGNWSETRRYKITHDTDDKKIASTWLDETSPLGELNMGHPETLSDFVEWGMKSYPAEKTILIMWDHGGGWRSDVDNNYRINKGVCWDDTNGGDYLEMREVKSALEVAKNRVNRTINTLGFDVCLAGMMEVAYEVKDVVSENVVFSQALVPGNGWDYENWLTSVKENSDISATDFATSAVNTFKAEYSGKSNVTMSLFDITKIDALKTSIDEFVAQYTNVDVEPAVINSAFDNSDLFSSRKNYIDLGLFMNYCATYLTNADSKTKAANVVSKLNDAILAKGNTGGYVNTTGLNIYFHKFTDYEWEDYRAPYCDFAEESNWKTFVENYDKDGLAPLFIDGYPKATNLSANVFDLNVKSNKTGIAYYIITTEDAQPTVAQIKEGKNSAGDVVENGMKGELAIERYKQSKVAIGNLTSAQEYFVYIVLEDNNGKTTDNPVKLSVTTLNRKVATFEDLLLANNAFWNGSDMSGRFSNGGFTFPNYYSSVAWSGFAYSNRTDASVSGIPGQYTAIAGNGAEESKNYGVAYVFGTLLRLDIQDSGNGVPVSGMYVTNNNFAYHSMKNGDAIAKKFGGESGNDPDWFKLTIKGVDAQGHYTGDVDFYLADFRFDDNSKDYILKKWKWVDLTSLGNVVKLEFRISSSDGGSGSGMNTPGYFCLDNLNGDAPVDKAPYVKNPIADISVDENSDSRIIDLNGVFADDEDDEITYSIVSNSNEDLISASLNGNNLNIDFEDYTHGNSVITIRATANEKSVETTVNITVNDVDFAPYVVNKANNVTVNENSADKTINISNVFADHDGDNLTVTAISENENLVTSKIEGGNLVLSFAKYKHGSAVITLKATANGKYAETTLDVVVNDVDFAPYVSNEISDITVDENSDDKTIDISNVFADHDGDDLTITANSGNEDLVTTSLDGNTLTLKFIDNKFGNTEVTLTATSNGKSVETEFNVTVNEVDVAPVLVKEIADIIVEENDAEKVINLDEIFNDEDGDDIEFTVVSNTNEDVVNSQINGASLTVSFVQDKFGEVDITIRATANGKSVETSFKVTVNKATAVDVKLSENVKTYPNPFVDFITVESPEALILSVRLYTQSGSEVYSAKVNSDNYKIHTNNLVNGIYILKIETIHGTLTNKIVKN